MKLKAPRELKEKYKTKWTACCLSCLDRETTTPTTAEEKRNEERKRAKCFFGLWGYFFRRDVLRRRRRRRQQQQQQQQHVQLFKLSCLPSTASLFPADQWETTTCIVEYIGLYSIHTWRINFLGYVRGLCITAHAVVCMYRVCQRCYVSRRALSHQFSYLSFLFLFVLVKSTPARGGGVYRK